MLTTPGVIRLSIGARLGTAPPPTSGISPAAKAGCGSGAMATTAPINRSADKFRFILEDLADSAVRRQETTVDMNSSAR
jgi:hypothetical protein